MYYPVVDYVLQGYRKSSRKGKMYDAILKNKSNGKLVYVPFGDNSMGNFKDDTNLNLYPHLIHGDKERRRRYKARAKGKVKKGYYSPSFFSYFILW